MPLSELPNNHSTRNAVGQPQEDRQDGTSRTGTPGREENLEILKNPSSIQSMLRNTTETGNVGQFSIKPSRKPPSLPRPSKASVTPSKQRQPGAYYNRHEDGHIRHTPLQSRQETAASNGPGLQSQIPRPYRGPARSPSVEDFRSYSTTKSSYASHSLTAYHPHTNGGHGSPGVSYSSRPRSPFAYPTRLKRPGYRPSSPALSEFNKQNRSQTSLHRRPSYRTNSPSSLHTNGAPSPWQKGVNRSDPLLRYYPQSAILTSGRAPSPSPTLTRPPTPKPSLTSKSIASSTNDPPATTNGSWINPQSPDTLPVFYDYSEAFEEQGAEQQDYSQYVTMSTGTLTEHAMPDTATTTYYELDLSPDTTSRIDLSSENSFPKLKTQAMDNKFDMTTSQFEVDDQGSTHALHKDLSEVPELPEGEMSDAEVDVPLAKHDPSPLHQKEQLLFPKQAPPLMATAEHSEQLSDQEQGPESISRVEDTAITLPLPESPKKSISSPITSHSTQSSPQHVPGLEEDSVGKVTEAIPCSVSSPPRAGHPVGDDDHGKGPGAENRQSPPLVRAVSYEDHSAIEHTITEIISPTPERSTISHSTISRFSKILSINDDPLDLDELANRIKGRDRADSPMQTIMDSRTRAARIEPSWRKRSVQLRDVATRQNAADFALVEVSDSEDEPELTQGLRQTFCKPDDLPLDHQPTSPPITLPSQLVHRGYPGLLNIRRSPAVRRTTSGLRKLRDPPIANGDQDFGSPGGSPTHTALTMEVKQPSPVQLNANQDTESPRKSSFSESSAADVKPPPPPSEALPLLPSERPAVVSLSPPVAPHLLSLPFSFMPLIQRRSEDDTASAAELEVAASSFSGQGEKANDHEETAAPTIATKYGSERGSIVSSPDSRPWNLDTSYPWSDQQPKLEVTMPEPIEDPNRSTRSFPRFRFKVQRASSTTGGKGITTKYPLALGALSNPFASSHDTFQRTVSGRKRYPDLSVMPGQINSSHDVIRSSPNRTRFVESFETQSPRITLVPPSPGFEARSFFSDDSSQMRPRGAFRNRFSALRNRTSRGASTDEPRGYDRGLLSSALGRSRASGRSSRQSQNTAVTAGASSRASRTKRARRRLVNKIRSWWQRGEDRVREWRWRRRYNGAIGRSASADLYSGV